MSGKNYVDALLTNIAKGYRPLVHVNELILPPLGVNKQSAKIAVFDASNLRIISSIKAPEGETPTVAMNISQADAYVLEEHALKAMASDKAAENQEQPFDEQKDKTEFVMDLMSIGREHALASFMNTYTNFTNYLNTLATTTLWGGAADHPLQDITTGIETVVDAIGIPREMLSIVMGSKVFNKFIGLDEVRVSLGANYQLGLQQVTAAQVAAALGVRQVIVAGGVYNTAMAGQADSLGAIWGNHCWIGYIPAQPKLKEHCFGFTVRRRAGVVVSKWRDEDIGGWWIKATDEFDQWIMNEKAMYMIKDCI